MDYRPDPPLDPSFRGTFEMTLRLILGTQDILKLMGAGTTCVIGSAALRLHANAPLNPKSDIDSVVVLNGSLSLEFCVANIVSKLYSLIGNSNKKASSVGLTRPAIEIQAHHSEKGTCDRIADIFNDQVLDFPIGKEKPINGWTPSGPVLASTYYKLQTDLKDSNKIYPYRISVIGERDGRWLIKVQDARILGYDERSYPVYRDYYDINVYKPDIPVTERLTTYMDTFPPQIISVGRANLDVASKEMLICQQIDLFYNSDIARIAPRVYSEEAKDLLLKTWKSIDYEQQMTILSLFMRPQNTTTSGKPVVELFMRMIMRQEEEASYVKGGSVNRHKKSVRKLAKKLDRKQTRHRRTLRRRT